MNLPGAQHVIRLGVYGEMHAQLHMIWCPITTDIINT